MGKEIWRVDEASVGYSYGMNYPECMKVEELKVMSISVNYTHKGWVHVTSDKRVHTVGMNFTA